MLIRANIKVTNIIIRVTLVISLMKTISPKLNQTTSPRTHKSYRPFYRIIGY